MALSLPQLLGDSWEDEMLRDASDLLAAVGYGPDSDAWLPLGIGLDVGRAYVGNVGSGEVKDFTALGDVVNTAARLQSSAEAGQIVISGRLFDRLSERPPHPTPTPLELQGQQEARPPPIMDMG